MSSGIQRGIEAAGFTEPRPIQSQTIASALDGRDILGLAQTGTGKTAAFALPILERLLDSPRQERRGPRALVVAPTRELASQIQAEMDLLGNFTKIRSTVVFGGINQRPQVRALASRPEILVACPGRLLDLVNQRAVNLGSVEMLVLDEADHMFDMGFLPDLRRILRALPTRRQNLLFSATMPREIRKLADEVLHNPKVVELAHSTPADTIEHALYHVSSNEQKVALLQHLLEGEDFTSAIVFLRTKHRAKRLAQQLAKTGKNAIALQGNMSQGQRERAMKGFRNGQYDVLVATDIAARGIDVSDVSHVVNFDVPNTPDAYTHRIGRTGRSEQSGKAFTFVLREDASALRAIEKRLGARIDSRDMPQSIGQRRQPREREADSSFGPNRTGRSKRSPRGIRKRRTSEDYAAAIAAKKKREGNAKPGKPAVPFGTISEPGARRSRGSDTRSGQGQGRGFGRTEEAGRPEAATGRRRTRGKAKTGAGSGTGSGRRTSGASAGGPNRSGSPSGSGRRRRGRRAS